MGTGEGIAAVKGYAHGCTDDVAAVENGRKGNLSIQVAVRVCKQVVGQAITVI